MSRQDAPPVLELLDFVRGVGITGVVLVHAVRGWFGWQGVHLFVVLSGLVLGYAFAQRDGADWPAWFRRRARRILPTYWATALAGAAVLLTFPEAVRPGETAGSLLRADLTLTRNLAWRTMFGPVNASLWFVPLLAGLYLAFPPVATALRRGLARGPGAFALALALPVAVELAWRAVAVLWWDGMPVGYGHGILRGLGHVPAPRDLLPPEVGFQLWAPFGQFPARLGEFALGVAAGLLVQRHPEAMAASVRQPLTAAAGAALWLGGASLLYAGPAGWIAADLLLAAGLTILALAAASRARQATPGLFRRVSWLGGWSYYLFLAHVLVGSTAALAAARLGLASLPAYLALAAATVVGTVLACRGLRRLDPRAA